jgi:N-glycosylase/DNA lyase
MQFAGDVVLDGRAETIAERAVDAAAGQLQRLKMVVPNVAAREGVEVDSLANFLAYRLAQQGENWWGAANNLQRHGDPWRTARDVLVERIEFGRLNPIDRQLLLAALRARAPEPTSSVGLDVSSAAE